MHQCELPGWWARRRAGIRYGSFWECPVCDRQWQWTAGDWNWERERDYWRGGTRPAQVVTVRKIPWWRS